MADRFLQGAEVLQRRLAALGRRASGEDLRAAALAGGAEIRDEATRLAPETRDPEPIVLGDVEVSGSRASVDIGYDQDGAWYLSFAETGTAFQSAEPHLRPAIDRREAVTGAVGRPLRRGIDAARRA